MKIGPIGFIVGGILLSSQAFLHNEEECFFPGMFMSLLELS